MNRPNEEAIKSAVLDVLRENPELLGEAVRAYLKNENLSDETAEARRQRLRAMIQQDFDQFDDVFRALA